MKTLLINVVYSALLVTISLIVCAGVLIACAGAVVLMS